jgi:hypothetical protein
MEPSAATARFGSGCCPLDATTRKVSTPRPSSRRARHGQGYYAGDDGGAQHEPESVA